ncbi:unnamed protein product, partial [Timema podura]|nr:unnamed protein product [Timema podura]
MPTELGIYTTCASLKQTLVPHCSLKNGPKPEPSDALALVLLCIQKGSPDQAITVLNSLSPKQLKNILVDNYFLMFEGNDARTRT